ncbi:hypothetical protein RJ55_07521 [Drechmeria coniospora]|nr:hypothetical protein RJ55_07521 [Drechmeria coniospora]
MVFCQHPGLLSPFKVIRSRLFSGLGSRSDLRCPSPFSIHVAHMRHVKLPSHFKLASLWDGNGVGADVCTYAV